MQRRWRKSAVLVVVTATLVVMGGCAGDANTATSDTPIDAMTPAQLFVNPELRALARAAQRGDVKKIDALIAKGVDVNGKGRYGETPLFSAFQVRNKKGFKALLEHGADPNLIDDTGQTLMNQIAGYSSTNFMKFALKYGANPNLVEPQTGDTPLYAAAGPYGGQNIPLLLKAGVDIDHQNNSGDTALINAADANQYDIVYELLKAGANYRLKDKYGKDLRFDVDLSIYTMNPSGHAWEMLQKVIGFLRAHDFWPPPKSQQCGWCRNPSPPKSRQKASDFATLKHQGAPASRTAPTSIASSPSTSRAAILNRLSAITKAPGAASSGFGVALGCVKPSGLSNKATPMSLDVALAKCIVTKQLHRAVFIGALARAYARFDTLRVADKTAHGVTGEVLFVMLRQLPKSDVEQYYSQIQKVAHNAEQLKTVCAQIQRIGRPEYYPEYMIAHGMQMYTGSESSSGLVANFNAKAAWEKVLSDTLHCPKH